MKAIFLIPCPHEINLPNLSEIQYIVLPNGQEVNVIDATPEQLAENELVGGYWIQPGVAPNYETYKAVYAYDTLPESPDGNIYPIDEIPLSELENVEYVVKPDGTNEPTTLNPTQLRKYLKDENYQSVAIGTVDIPTTVLCCIHSTEAFIDEMANNPLYLYMGDVIEIEAP